MIALCDAHVHLAQLGRARSFVQLDACRSGAELLDRIAARAADAPPDAWIIAHGARPAAWESPRWPTLAALDGAVGGRPAVAWCFDYHALLASTAALTAAGLPDAAPPGGIVERDDDGSPTGLCLEAAALSVWDAVPNPAPAQRRAQVLDAAQHLASLGFVEAHDLKSPPWLAPTLAELHDAGELPLRVELFPLIEDAEFMHAESPSWSRDGLRLAGVKIFTDGTLNSRTAHVLHPFADPVPDHPNGMAMMSPPEIRDAVRHADALALPIAAHAIGDAAVRNVLDAIERVRPRTPGARVEHAEIIDALDVPRFAALGVTASVQPCHLLADAEALRRSLPHRLERVLPLRELIDAGCRPGELLRFGSDAPIVRADPADSLRAATARRRDAEPGHAAIAPEQAISEPEARAAFAPSPV